MNAYRLVQSRRHVYQLRGDVDRIAEIALHHGRRANIRTNDATYDLHAIEGIRKRVMQYGDRVRTVARSSSLDRYAIDLENSTLYWHALPGPRGTYCWMTGDARIVARFSPAAEGSFTVEAESEIPAHVLVVGSYLLLHTTIEADAYYASAPRPLRSSTTRDSF